MLEKKKISTAEFLKMFGFQKNDSPPLFLEKFRQMNTEYREPTREEFEEYVFMVLKLISSPGIKRSKEENLKAWETGWGENLAAVGSDKALGESLKPRYFRPNKFLRYNKQLIVSENLNLEHDLFTLARYLLCTKYLSSYEDVYEFGSGSCQNLLMLSEMFPSKRLYGLDWASASQKIAEALSASKNLNIKGIVFDMMNPSPEVVLKPNSAVFTIHSLEQLDNQYEKLLGFIIAAKPAIIMHYEPIVEFYNRENFLDYLALLYSQKRNYLNGFWPALCRLKEEKKIEILEARRPYLGGVIHESSLIVWKPV